MNGITPTINKELLETLELHGIEEGILYIFDVTYGLNLYDNPDIIKRVNMLHLVDFNLSTKEPIVNSPLYNFTKLKEDKLESFNWVIDWMSIFPKINKERRGNKAECKRRMAHLFKEYPHLTKEILYLARDKYIDSLSDATYLKKPEKFIREGRATDKNFPILVYIDMVVNDDINIGTIL